MLSFSMRWVIIFVWFCRAAMADQRWRETLLAEAHLRIQTWYTEPSLLEAPKTRDGITMRLMKQDMRCGGDSVPVTFAEFDVEGARPVDIFNTMLDTAGQRKWNHACSSASPIAEREEEGARAWAVVFEIPFVSKREFLQWQVADANFAKEDFWLVFSTQKGEELRKQRPIEAGAVESQNCLGAYHITKGPKGAHVVVTQQVNVHPAFMFPLHQVLNFFPPAWQGTIDFVKQMSGNARQRALSGSSTNSTLAPAFMLRTEAPRLSEPSTILPMVPSLSVVDRAEVFPILEHDPKPLARPSALMCAMLIVLIPIGFVCMASLGFGTGRIVAQKMDSFVRLGAARKNANTDLETATACE